MVSPEIVSTLRDLPVVLRRRINVLNTAGGNAAEKGVVRRIRQILLGCVNIFLDLRSVQSRRGLRHAWALRKNPMVIVIVGDREMRKRMRRRIVSHWVRTFLDQRRAARAALPAETAVKGKLLRHNALCL
jgi:hypothetical protein